MDYREWNGTYYIRIDKGEKLVATLLSVCRKESVASAIYTGIGACSHAELQTFIPESGTFETQHLEGMLELLNVTGNVVSDDSWKLYHHTHATLSFKQGGEHRVSGGHVKDMTVLYTAEIELRPVTGGVICRRFDEETGTGFWSLKSESDRIYRFYGWEAAGGVTCRKEQYAGVRTPLDLYDALSRAWSANTCAPRLRDEWTEENRTLGQCSITAFLAQDIFGGKVYGMPRPGGTFHCYNVVDGTVFDLTSEQFGEEQLSYTDNPEQFREVHFAEEEKKQRYLLLKQRLKEATDATGREADANG